MAIESIESVLFVCMGNICRSPLAEGIARARLAERGLALRIDSAGTHAYHVGEPPDPRAREVARRFGTPIDDLRARQVVAEDFERFDLILVADRQNLAALQRFDPARRHAELGILPIWCGSAGCDEVPDPYYDDDRAFDHVYRLLLRCTDDLLGRLAERA